MKRTRVIFLTLLLSVIWLPQSVHAAVTTDHVVISELQTGTKASSSQEFIELYNPTDQPVALDGWQVQYHPATATGSWANYTSGGLRGNIPADGFYLIAPTTYLASADANFSSGMAAGGGSVQLVNASGVVIDLLGWGSAVEFEHAAAPVAPVDGSIERLPGITNPSGGNGLDTDNNGTDFVARAVAEPQSSTSAAEVPGEVLAMPTPVTGSNPPTGAPGVGSGTLTSDGSGLEINELLIDPVSPQTDAKNEFIELYNPGASAIELKGYKLKTGSNFHDSYTLPEMTITPSGYLALYSAQTKLALTNSGGAAELLDPSGSVIDTTATYDGSLPGQSFSRFGDDWQWTSALTPGAANQFVAPTTASPAAKTSSTKKTAVKAATKTTKAKAAAKTVKVPKSASTLVAAAEQKTAGLSSKWLIIGLATLTMGYAIYEFRYDLQNYLAIARRKYGTWRKARRPVGWR